MNENYLKTVEHLKIKNKILFLVTSNRWSGEVGGETAKSTQLAQKMAKEIGLDRVEIIDVSKLKIYPCEGNVSTKRGNTCGLKETNLKDLEKNPSGCHRCWASLNNPDDELWKVSKALLASEVVVFFGSIRWGQMNSFYQKLIERLTWLENRHSTLGEDNLLAKIEAGVIVLGHNWNSENVVVLQKQVLSFFGFKVVESLSWFWQFSTDDSEESNESYQTDVAKFKEEFFV